MDGFRIKHLKQDIIGTHLNQNQKKEVNQGDTENQIENRIENQEGAGDKMIINNHINKYENGYFSVAK